MTGILMFLFNLLGLKIQIPAMCYLWRKAFKIAPANHLFFPESIQKQNRKNIKINLWGLEMPVNHPLPPSGLCTRGNRGRQMEIEAHWQLYQSKTEWEDVSWVQDFLTRPRWNPHICPDGGQAVWVPPQGREALWGAGNPAAPPSPAQMLSLFAHMAHERSDAGAGTVALGFLPANGAHILHESMSRQ